jgi:hypothetical protein
MIRHPRLLIAPTIAFLLMFAAGCKGPPLKPTKFNDALAKANKRLATSSRPFRKALLPLGTGQEANASEVQSAFAGMQRALSEVRDEIDDISPPRSSKTGENALTQYKNFLNSQETILNKHLKPIVDTVSGGGSPAEKWAFVQEKFAQVDEEEGRAMGSLKPVLGEFQREHNLRPSF